MYCKNLKQKLNKKIYCNKLKKEIKISVVELKQFVLFTIYYQEVMDLDKETTRKINDIMDYHFSKVYGEEYNKNYMNIVDDTYQCICKFEDS